MMPLKGRGKFLGQFTDLSVDVVLGNTVYKRDNYDMNFVLNPGPYLQGEDEFKEEFLASANKLEKRGKREGSLQEIELAGVKYFHHGDLKEFTHDTKQKNLLGKTLFGRILRGRDSNGNEIIIKTWDVYAPISRVMVLHPYALCDEVAFLTKDERLGGFGRHQNLPNLVGYTFDNTFAVIYQMNIKNSLQSMLDSDELDWNTRLDIAIQVAKLIMDFHSRLVPVGGIDVSNMLIDEEWNVKLCEFGLRSHVGVAETRRITWVYTGGSYAAYIPEVNCSGGKFVLKSDIYAFGIFLMELICKVKPTAAEDLWEGRMGWFLQGWAIRHMDTPGINFVDPSLTDDLEDGIEITNLVKLCFQEDLHSRPSAAHLLKVLEKVKQRAANKKPKLI
ncbi:hypothetical protein DM860_012726 [Cuscuta australis]|uniref:Protein kinase domain-containing protein n=1 Tax=Cuscuta australis TaxID=267555 RepID=A0A328DYP3_9ASTE|nr:hypothetical protein DM860_012726 [Cuscuta australis]